MDIDKKYIQSLISENDLERAISVLVEYSNKENFNQITNELTVLSSQIGDIKSKYRVNTLEYDVFQRHLNRINFALLEICDYIFSKQTSKVSEIKKSLNFYSSLLENPIDLEIKDKSPTQNQKINEKLKDLLTKIDSQVFQILVLGLSKSGKSTFINALLSEEYLPMSNVPETSFVLKIRHSEDNKLGTLQNDTQIKTGADSIRNYIKDKNKNIRDGIKNENEEIVLYVPLKEINNHNIDDIQFELVDTPGFGEFQSEGFKKNMSINDTLIKLITDSSVILYLLDYTKLKTAEENDLIDQIANLRPDIIENIQERLFFIVNKTDMENRLSLTRKETKIYVEGLIKQFVPKISADKIFTISAYDALLSRQILKLDKSEFDERVNNNDEMVADFMRVSYGRSYNWKRVNYQEAMAQARIMLDEAEILKIEKNILKSIYKDKKRILYDSFLDEYEREIQKVKDQTILEPDPVPAIEIATVEFIKEKSDWNHWWQSDDYPYFNIYCDGEFLGSVKSSANYQVPVGKHIFRVSYSQEGEYDVDSLSNTEGYEGHSDDTEILIEAKHNVIRCGYSYINTHTFGLLKRGTGHRLYIKK